MRAVRKSLPKLAVLGFCTGIALLASPSAFGQDGCPQGSYSVVNSPDGSALTVLFDNFIVATPASGENPAQRRCDLQIPLNLPAGMSLGVYRVDYRGFAQLARKQEATLTVVHHLGGDRKGHRFQRKVKGNKGEDFTFTENIGAGLMKRVGCGEEAKLDVTIDLALNGGSGAEAMASLDTVDGAPKGGLVYFLDLKKCR